MFHSWKFSHPPPITCTPKTFALPFHTTFALTGIFVSNTPVSSHFWPHLPRWFLLMSAYCCLFQDRRFIARFPGSHIVIRNWPISWRCMLFWRIVVIGCLKKCLRSCHPEIPLSFESIMAFRNRFSDHFLLFNRNFNKLKILLWKAIR